MHCMTLCISEFKILITCHILYLVPSECFFSCALLAIPVAWKWTDTCRSLLVDILIVSKPLFSQNFYNEHFYACSEIVSLGYFPRNGITWSSYIHVFNFIRYCSVYLSVYIYQYQFIYLRSKAFTFLSIKCLYYPFVCYQYEFCLSYLRNFYLP